MAPPEVRRAVILFADFMNSTEVANNLGVVEYDTIIDEFQRVARQVLDLVVVPAAAARGWQLESSIRGDEVNFFLHAPPGTPVQSMRQHGAPAVHPHQVWLALACGVYLRLFWLVSGYNRVRLQQGLLPRGLGVGIHEGPVVFGQHWGRPKMASSEGFAISLAKRIESEARNGGASQIMVSDAIKSVCSVEPYEPVRFSAHGRPKDLKGISTPPHIHEIVAIPCLGAYLRHERAETALRSADYDIMMPLLRRVAVGHGAETWLRHCVAMLLHIRNPVGTGKYPRDCADVGDLERTIKDVAGPSSPLPRLRTAEGLALAALQAPFQGQGASREALLEKARRVLDELRDTGGPAGGYQHLPEVVECLRSVLILLGLNHEATSLMENYAAANPPDFSAVVAPRSPPGGKAGRKGRPGA
jgi:hypothetical protein